MSYTERQELFLRKMGRLVEGMRRAAIMKPGIFLKKVRARLNWGDLSCYFWRWILRRKCTQSGRLIIEPGWPKLRIFNEGEVYLGDCCKFFSGVRLQVYPQGRLVIGDGTYLHMNTKIFVQQEVRIGYNCMISWEVIIMDTDHHSIEGGPTIAKPVIIGDKVWIGCRAIILKGVHIGDRAIIGAGAIVTHDVPPGGIVTGPAATLRRIRPPESPEAELASVLAEHLTSGGPLPAVDG